MQRIALFSDIHGNSVALDAVLADIEASGITERYCLGDLIGYGPDPAGVIARLRDAGIPTIPGNYDEGVASRRGSCGCYYATSAAREFGERSYEFTDLKLRADDKCMHTSARSSGTITLLNEGHAFGLPGAKLGG